MDINAASLPELQLVGYAQRGHDAQASATQELDEDGNAPPEVAFDDLSDWEQTFAVAASDAIVQLVEAIASEPGERLAQGFHLVSVPVKVPPRLVPPRCAVPPASPPPLCLPRWR